MEQENYKQEIEQTRKGNVGSSDAKMLQQICELGYVPESAKKRMAIIKGLCENDNITNAAMRYGDFIELQIFECLKAKDSRWQSNPCIISKEYKRKNCGVLDHIDYMLQDDENKTLILGEAKATRYNFSQTRSEYIHQLYHHYLLGRELAKNLGGYRLKVVLFHYCTIGIDVENDFNFDPSRLTVRTIHLPSRIPYNLDKAMNIVDEYLENLDVYVEDDEIESKYLPAKVKEEFETITNILTEIKEREKKVDDFKQKLYAFMLEKNVKSIKNDTWSITRVDSSESVQFDSKRFLDEYMDKHPIKAKKLFRTYEKRVKRKGSVQIRLNNK